VLQKGQNIFTIEAVDEGTLKPNTVMMRIIDLENDFELLSNLKKKEKASITILKMD
jgi:hypothetical protein